MKFLKINSLLLGAVFALSFSSCDKENDSDSTVTAFPTYALTTEAGATGLTVAEEDEDVITFKVALPETQINDVTLVVQASEASTAVEDVDFEIEAHEFDIPAMAGQDSVEIEIHILQDFIADEEDETIYLTFSTAGPSGLEPKEVLVATIIDSDMLPPPPVPQPVFVEMSWDVPFEYGGETFQLADFSDLDFYLYDGDGNEVSGYSAATGAEPEEFELDPDMADGTYEIWVNFWDRYNFEGEAPCVDETGGEYQCLDFTFPINITFTREIDEEDQVVTLTYENYSHTFSDAFYRVGNVNTNPYVEYHLADIVVSGGTFEFINKDGDSVGELRQRTKQVKQDKKPMLFPNL